MRKGSPEMSWHCRMCNRWLMKNLKYGRINRDETFHGSFYNRGDYARYMISRGYVKVKQRWIES